MGYISRVVARMAMKLYEAQPSAILLSSLQRTLSPYWKKKNLSPSIKSSNGSHTDNVLENVFFGTRRGLNYRLVVFLGCKPSTNYFM